MCKQAGHTPDSRAGSSEIIGASDRTESTTPAFQPAGTAGTEAERGRKIKRAKNICENGWECPSHDEVYSGILLGKAANADQRGILRGQMHDARDAAFAYFDARLLDHRWMTQLRIFLLDKREKDDYAMAQKGAIGGIAIPMLKNGVLFGVQRVYLNKDGRKVSRMMLGELGTMNLAPLSDRPLIALPDTVTPAGLVFWGEGFETCAISTQASGLPVLVLFTAGQIVTRSQMYRDQAAQATPEQIADMAMVGMLVDRDISLTGQKDCVKALQNLRAAGMSGLYLEPPMSVDGGEKGADWADVGLTLGLEACGLALAVAMAKQPVIPEERAAAAAVSPDQDHDYGDYQDADYPQPLDAEDMDLADFGVKARRRNWRKIEGARAEPSILIHTADTARDVLKTGIERLVDSYIDWLEMYKNARDMAGEDAKDEDIMLPEFAPFLVRPTMGAGKSTHLKDLPNNESIRAVGGAVRAFVATKDECASFFYANPAFFRYHGRSPEATSPGHCQNYEAMMKTVEQGHIPQSEFCFHCKNGLKWSIETHGQDSKQGKKSLEKLHGMGLDDAAIKEIHACTWQSHLRISLAARFVVATHHSFSENLAAWHKDDGTSVPALCCFDEDVPFSAPLEKVTQEKVSEWSKRNLSNVRMLERMIETGGAGDPAVLRDDLRVARDSQALLLSFAHAIADMSGQSGRISKESDVWKAIDDLILIGNKSSKSLAGWEKIAFERNGDLSAVPLRAAYGIAQTLKVNDGLVENGVLHVSAVRPILERLGKMPTAFFDATPSPVVTSVVKAKNGVVIDAIARQHVAIARYTDRFYGLKALKIADVKRKQQEADRYEAILQHFAGRKFIFHKAAAELVNPVGERDDVDHWGHGHRAHNRFSGNNLCVAGSFFTPQTVIRQVYQSHRLAALVGGADPEDWPLMQDYTPAIDKSGHEFDDAFERDVWISEGECEVQSMVPLPRQAKIRDWFLTLATIESVQAIGRARGVNAKPDAPLSIAIFGGVPLFGLGAYGLTVHAYEDEPEAIGLSKVSADAISHASAQGEATDAALKIVATGRTVGRDSVSSQVRTDRENAKVSADTKKPEESHSNHEDNADSGDDEGVCAPKVISTYNGGDTNPPPAVSEGLNFANYQEWLAAHGLIIFAKHMKANGRAAQAVKAAQAAIDKQPAQDVESMFEKMEAFATAYDRDVRSGINITFADAVRYDSDGFDDAVCETAREIAAILDAAEADPGEAKEKGGMS
jgi:hypothetical protein